MGKFRNISWFKNEPILNCLLTPFLKAGFFALILDDIYYNRINKKYIEAFEQKFGEYRPTDFEQNIINSLNSEGIALAHISDFVSDEIAVGLRERFNRLMVEKGEEYINDISVFNKDLFLNGDLTEDYSILSFVFNRAFFNIASTYLQQIARVGYVQENLVIATEGERTSSRNWHRDGADKKILKVFLYHSVVQKQNGPFEFIKHTHYKGVHKDIMSLKSTGLYGGSTAKDRLQSLVDQNDFLNNNIVSAEGGEGTIIFCDTSGIHRGGHCSTGERRMLTLAYYSNAALLNVPKFKISKTATIPQDRNHLMAFGLK